MPTASKFLPVARSVAAQREFERECVEMFADVVQIFGVAKSIGQIYGLLFASPLPLSFSDIVERLDISKGSASQGLQLLRALGAIRYADEGAADLGAASDVSRRISYLPELSLRRLVRGVLSEQIRPMATTCAARLVRLRRLAAQQGAAGGFCRGRVKQLGAWQRRIKTVLPILNALLAQQNRG